ARLPSLVPFAVAPLGSLTGHHVSRLRLPGNCARLAPQVGTILYVRCARPRLLHRRLGARTRCLAYTSSTFPLLINSRRRSDSLGCSWGS
ncbi:hypothetical protein HYPSUDRAFT_652728, partial [Hypholoma sublateritium FD-334 SS-4]